MFAKLIRMILVCLALIEFNNSLSAQLVVDAAKPYVYIEFDHKSESQNSNRTGTLLWLRLVNNSTLPLRIRTYSKGKSGAETGINYSVVLTPEGKLKYLNAKEEVPSGHVQDVSSSELIPSGGSLVFTIPATDVSEYWYIDISFRFEIPRKMRGNDPTLHVSFSQQQMP
jgi:hypothetical protein